MPEPPLVSVVIPNLHSPIIDKTLAGLISQDFSEKFEIIVVGQDRYGFVKSVPSICFIETPVPVSPAIARNTGAEHAMGHYLVFIDADCVPASDWLHKLVTIARQHDWVVVGGGVEFPRANFWTFTDNVASFYPYFKTSPLGEREILPSLNILISREIFLEVGGFDSRYPRPAGEDSDLSIRLIKNGYRLHFHPEAVVCHLPQRGSFRSLMEHAYTYGRFSIKVDPRYQDDLNAPFTLRSWWAALLFSPVMSLGVIIKMIPALKGIWMFLTLPLVFLIKIVWCFGAAKTLKEGSPLLDPDLQSVGV